MASATSRLTHVAVGCLVILSLLVAGGQAAARAQATAPAAAPALQPAPGQGLRAGDFVAVCGDSITEQKLYSVYIEDYMLMCQPAPRVRTMQAGWGGEVSWGFLPRMDRDVLALHPTVATTCYGMNDGGYAPLTQERATRYRETQRKIVERFKQAGLHIIVLGSPGCVDSDSFGGHNPAAAKMYNKTLAQLTEIDRQIAAQEGVIFADIYDPMMNVMAKAKAKYGHGYDLCGIYGSGVHPFQNGHLVMAYAFLKALGCDGDIGTITMDLPAGTAQATGGHRILSSKAGTVEVESTRYPFCFFGDPSDPHATTGVLEFMPFNADLNRFRLVVKGANPTAQYRVTWGKASRDFSGAQLGAGINLAADFLDNPFCDAFTKVQAAVQKQQDYETLMTKMLLHNLPAYEQALPQEASTFKRLKDEIIARDSDLAKASAAAVKPVRYTISVEPVK